MNMQNLMKQAQKMQEEMIKKQEELEASIFEGSVASGLVKVELNGKKELVNIKLDSKVVDPDDIEMLEDLIKVAINEAGSKVDEAKDGSMGDMGIPGGLF
ncbi:MAG: YbaB/EbfC family nucleoid-associated protein [Clostridia bacterium]|nr:YbaB/EbfC family nucleoid-associated protein [Clostridia bacterium]